MFSHAGDTGTASDFRVLDERTAAFNAAVARLRVLIDQERAVSRERKRLVIRLLSRPLILCQSLHRRVCLAQSDRTATHEIEHNAPCVKFPETFRGARARGVKYQRETVN